MNVYRSFRQRVWRPPRAHGEVQPEREVTFLELFYDLVYVVVIANLAAELAHDISWRGVADFAVFFGMIWIAWVSGSMLHDLHGRNDVRTRTYLFIQMALIALLAVYAGGHDEEISGFAVVYTILFALFGWQWFEVRRQDTEEFASLTTRYLFVIALTVAVMTISVFLVEDVQLAIWAVMVGLWILIFYFGMTSTTRHAGPVRFVGASTVERFGLFTIIVLGEVVVVVVEGLAESTRDFETMATGILALIIGFGLWWNYFDATGRRLPRNDEHSIPVWLVAQFPLTMAIAAAGASMVTLIEHGSDSHAPENTTWLLVGSVSLGLAALSVLIRTLEQFDQYRSVLNPVSIFSFVVALAILPIGLWQPAPVYLALILVVALSLTWNFGVIRWLQHPESGDDPLEF